MLKHFTVLQDLSNSQIPEVKAAAEGAIWKVEGEQAYLQKLHTKPGKDRESPQSMFAYQPITAGL